jgi:long-subunit acyl-CoA synthetase (AMP-forming)
VSDTIVADVLSCLGKTDPDAVLLQDSDAAYSTDEIVQRCKQLASTLAELGIRSLGLHADNGVDWVVTDLACQQAGLLLVPIPTFFSSGQVSHLIAHCAFDALLTDNPGSLGSLANMDVDPAGRLPGSSLFLFKLPAQDSPPSVPAGTGKITFTSGSTGLPRGVCLSKQQQLAQAKTLRDCVNLHAPRHLCVLPLSTLLENIAGVYAPLLAGGTVLLPSLEEIGFHGSELRHPARLMLTITRLEPDSLILVPQLLTVLVAALQQGWQAPDSLKFIAVGGSKVSTELLAEATALGLPVFEGYGLSECCSVVSLNSLRNSLPGSCGMPLPGLQLAIRDGEIVVQGNAMLGYLGEPESWYPAEIATGDIGHIDAQGFLHVSGRKKNLIISSLGRNISPEWVESELLANPQLAEVVLIGDARPYCAALISLRDRSMSQAALERWIATVNDKLPDYAQVKRYVLLDVPLAAQAGLITANGRPRREAIDQALSEQIESMYEDDAIANYA